MSVPLRIRSRISLSAFRRSGPAMALALLLTACSSAAQAVSVTMYRDPNCGCCLAWADHAHDHFRASHEDVSVETIDSDAMGAVKARLGVPADLASCHTAVIDGYVIEGHVPAADIERLLAERPEGVTGLSVPAMPVGSPGMEMGDRRDAYQVIAFGPGGRRIWASYSGG